MPGKLLERVSRPEVLRAALPEGDGSAWGQPGSLGQMGSPACQKAALVSERCPAGGFSVSGIQSLKDAVKIAAAEADEDPSLHRILPWFCWAQPHSQNRDFLFLQLPYVAHNNFLSWKER